MENLKEEFTILHHVTTPVVAEVVLPIVVPVAKACFICIITVIKITGEEAVAADVAAMARAMVTGRNIQEEAKVGISIREEEDLALIG